MKKTTAEIREYIKNSIASHFSSGGVFIDLNSGDIEKELGISNCTPQVCGSMQDVMMQYPQYHVIERPHNDGWAGTRLTIRYYKDSAAYKADNSREEMIVRPPKDGSGSVTHSVRRVKQFAEVDAESIKANTLDFYNHIVKDPNGRFKSWEHCYEFFKANRHRKDTDSIDHMSLHLAFYLASWGMLRGSSFLLQKDYRVHLPAIKIMIEDKYEKLWGGVAGGLVDIVDLLLECSKRIEDSYQQQMNCKKPSQTLLTKTLLGVYGCTPAYDRFFIDGLKKYGLTATYGKRSLLEIFEFYRQNSEVFEENQDKIRQRGGDYTPMKLTDMFFWLEGVKLSGMTPDKAANREE